jgi:hypothetical protein
MRFVRGRVLDLGCGAGRVGLHLLEPRTRGGRDRRLPAGRSDCAAAGRADVGSERSTTPSAVTSASTRSCCSGATSASLPASGRVAACFRSSPLSPPKRADPGRLLRSLEGRTGSLRLRRPIPWQGWQGSMFARVRSRSLACADTPANWPLEPTGANGRERSRAFAMQKVVGSSPFIR